MESLNICLKIPCGTGTKLVSGDTLLAVYLHINGIKKIYIHFLEFLYVILYSILLTTYWDFTVQ